MVQSQVLQENTESVNKMLVKVMFFGLLLVVGSLGTMIYLGMLDISPMYFALVVGITFALYAIALVLYRIPSARKYFYYILPFQMFITISVAIGMLGAPAWSFFLWLVPVIYAGLYANRKAMRFVSLLVIVVAPLETLWLREGGIDANLSDVILNTAVMGVLVMRFNSLIGRSIAIIEKTEEEMNRNICLQKENERMMQEISKTTEEMGRVIKQLTEMTDDTRTAMNQIAIGSEQIMTSSYDSQQVLVDNQEYVVNQVESSKQLTQLTKQTVGVIGQARAQAVQGEEVVEKVASFIQTINKQSHDTSEKAITLADRTKEIHAFTEIIANIAKNVTVVAINASIEASRAGVAGKTFQVVAEQVQSLAGQTTEAATAIGELAKDIQSDLNQINANMGENYLLVSTAVEVSQEALVKLQAIGQAVEEVQSFLRKVEVHAVEQDHISNNLSLGIEELRSKTVHNLSHIESAAASTEETAAIMDEFAAIVGRLRERADALQRILHHE